MTLKNRVLMGSMHTGLEEEKDGFHRMAAYYAARAAGGVGLIVTGGVAPNRAGWVVTFFPSSGQSFTGEGSSGLITDAVHASRRQDLHADPSCRAIWLSSPVCCADLDQGADKPV